MSTHNREQNSTSSHSTSSDILQKKVEASDNKKDQKSVNEKNKFDISTMERKELRRAFMDKDIEIGKHIMEKSTLMNELTDTEEKFEAKDKQFQRALADKKRAKDKINTLESQISTLTNANITLTKQLEAANKRIEKLKPQEKVDPQVKVTGKKRKRSEERN